MSTHCNKYPKCGCPSDIGINCGKDDFVIVKGGSVGPSIPEQIPIKRSPTEIEKQIVALAYHQFNGNIRAAKRHLKRKGIVK